MAKTAKSSRRKSRYYEGIGRRKTVIARVRVTALKQSAAKDSVKAYHILVNEKPFSKYFPTDTLQKVVEEPFRKLKFGNVFQVAARVKGGGIRGQAEAIRLGIARALRLYNPDILGELHAHGLLTRDPRMKERKKPGKRGARRGQQWSKR